MKFRVRIDGQEDQNVTQFCEPYVSSVIVQHTLPHGNPHYHMFIEDRMSLSIDAFRARVKRFFKPESRSDYSVKVCDEDKEHEYIQYLFNTKHGNVSRLVTHKYDSVTLNRLKESAQDITREFEARVTHRKSKGPTIYDIAEQVRDIAEQTHNTDLTVEWYTQTAITVLHKHRKTCEPNMLIKIVSTARAFQNKEFLVKKVQFYFQEN